MEEKLFKDYLQDIITELKNTNALLRVLVDLELKDDMAAGYIDMTDNNVLPLPQEVTTTWSSNEST